MLFLTLFLSVVPFYIDTVFTPGYTFLSYIDFYKEINFTFSKFFSKELIEKSVPKVAFIAMVWRLRVISWLSFGYLFLNNRSTLVFRFLFNCYSLAGIFLFFPF